MAGFGADADVAEVGEFGRALVAVVGDVHEGFEHPCHVVLGVGGKFSKMAHGRDVFAPAGEFLVNGLQGAAVAVVAGDVVDAAALGVARLFPILEFEKRLNLFLQ